MKNRYLNFLNMIDSLSRHNPGRVLDGLELALLEYVLRKSDQGKTLLVGDLLSLKKLGSQATLHGRVKKLSSLGYIKLISDHKDGRKKTVFPAETGWKYIRFMENCLINSMKNHNRT
jgi:DNA-binding MarR family transcriptional regulator